MNVNNKINVLELNVSSHLGGGQQHMYLLIKYIDKNRFRIFSVSQNNGPLYERFKHISEKIYNINLRKISIFNLIKLIIITLKNNINVIHSHGKGAGIYSRIVGLLTNRKVIHTLHGIHYTEYPWLLQKVYLTIERIFSLLTFKIINVSRSEQNLALSLKMYKPEKAVIIHNSIEKDRFDIDIDTTRYKDEFHTEGKHVFLTIGRYGYEKGLDILIRAADYILKKRNDVMFLLAGDGPEKDKLNELIHRYNIEPYIKLIGPREDIPQLLKFSDCFILPSRWEGLPITLLEAMAAKKVIIASQVMGNVDLIEHGKNGLLFKKEDYIDLADKIEYVLKNNCSMLSENAYHSLLSRFSLEDMVRQTELLYEAAVGI
jgi:glycosyltransferase involved in cell wall biosynthesis